MLRAARAHRHHPGHPRRPGQRRRADRARSAARAHDAFAPVQRRHPQRPAPGRRLLRRRHPLRRPASARTPGCATSWPRPRAAGPGGRRAERGAAAAAGPAASRVRRRHPDGGGRRSSTRRRPTSSSTVESTGAPTTAMAVGMPVVAGGRAGRAGSSQVVAPAVDRPAAHRSHLRRRGPARRRRRCRRRHGAGREQPLRLDLVDPEVKMTQGDVAGHQWAAAGTLPARTSRSGRSRRSRARRAPSQPDVTLTRSSTSAASSSWRSCNGHRCRPVMTPGRSRPTACVRLVCRARSASCSRRRCARRPGRRGRAPTSCCW